MKWISIFESLPDDFKKVQVTYVTNNMSNSYNDVIAFFDHKNGWQVENADGSVSKFAFNVIAWKALGDKYDFNLHNENKFCLDCYYFIMQVPYKLITFENAYKITDKKCKDIVYLFMPIDEKHIDIVNSIYQFKNKSNKYPLSYNDINKVFAMFCENGKLKDLIESSVEKIDDKIIAKPLDGDTEFIVEDDSLVSTNLLLFTPKIFDYLEEKLTKFLETNKNDLSKCEFLIPDVVKDAIKEDRIEVDLLSTNAIWHGVTYKEDKEEVVKAIDELIKEKVYPNKLW